MYVVNHTNAHSSCLAPTVERPVRVVGRDLTSNATLAAHSHLWGQLTYALQGAIRVTVGRYTWIVPPLRAIWIPANVEHAVTTLEAVRLRPLHVLSDIAPFQDQANIAECIVLDVSNLLRELMLALAELNLASEREDLLTKLILSEIKQATQLPLRITLPRDKRLIRLCNSIIANPGNKLTLADWATQAGASERTLARLFEQDCGMGFGVWRQQVRLAHSSHLVARGLPLSQVALELGYSSQAAFSSMFKKTFGVTPSVFFNSAGTNVTNLNRKN
ncbi:AraC family transcriptional regulator [Solimicrobium silvestre]|uniref:Helix-turn-helix domain n=1 Tax=Solimicrobium silvestre TaxID=2099400 RepID=A0A2S9GUX4_9BURK|nr:helix-turn-helix transcriptional regulator [Solimicrobium silvestre]PRC91519.1 Helix-turn-helix domain [Solimicrobium silvestre]